MKRALAALATLAVVAGVGLVARPAAAFVRYRTDTGLPFFWPQSCIFIKAYANDITSLTPPETMAASRAAAAAWSSEQNACSYLALTVDQASETETPPSTARFDYWNMLMFRHDWCKPNSMGRCTFEAAALAITSVWVNTKNGRIRDADIEVNLKYFVWTNLDSDPAGLGKQDLQNALTHEMGHLIGLDHTCYTPSLDENGNIIPPPVDDLGNVVPDCDRASPEVRATTMFASATPGDTSKRTLEPDDKAAVCAMYPVAEDPMTCPAPGPPPESGGCAFTPAAYVRSGGAGALLAMVALLSLARRGRRRRPSRNT